MADDYCTATFTCWRLSAHPPPVAGAVTGNLELAAALCWNWRRRAGATCGYVLINLIVIAKGSGFTGVTSKPRRYSCRWTVPGIGSA